MSGRITKHPVVVDEQAENDQAFELALSLVKLFDSARLALPAPRPGVELAKAGNQVLHRVIASKIFHGYQLEFVMNSGEVHYGFVIGLDGGWVQIYSTGYGEDFRQNAKYDLDFYTVDGPTRHWLNIANIESINENFFGVKHLTKKAQDDLNAERRAMVKVAERWLYPSA